MRLCSSVSYIATHLAHILRKQILLWIISDPWLICRWYSTLGIVTVRLVWTMALNCSIMAPAVDESFLVLDACLIIFEFSHPSYTLRCGKKLSLYCFESLIWLLIHLQTTKNRTTQNYYIVYKITYSKHKTVLDRMKSQRVSAYKTYIYSAQ